MSWLQIANTPVLRRLVAALLCGAMVPVAPILADEIDLDDPQAAIETWIRLKGDLSGKVTYEWMSGTVYGVPGDDVSRVLFGVESFTAREVRDRGDGSYEERTFFCRLYKDAVTGAYIETFVNPFTDDTVDLKPSCSKGQPLRMSAAGLELLSELSYTSTALGQPMTFTVTEADDQVILRHDAHATFIVPGTGEVRREMSIDTFKLPRDDLNDLRQTGLVPHYSWVSNTNWMSIFDMQGEPGHMIWSFDGRKFDALDDLPVPFRDALDRFVPSDWRQPIDWSE